MAFSKSSHSGAPRSWLENTVMPMLFRVCRHGRYARWAVLVGDRLYDEYLGREAAVLGAIQAVKDARTAKKRKPGIARAVYACTGSLPRHSLKRCADDTL